MTPFLQFRLWAKRGPLAERVATGAVAAVVLALLVWVAVPSGSGAGGTGSVSAAGASGPQASASSASGAGARSGATAVPGVPTAGGGGGGSAAGGPVDTGGATTGPVGVSGGATPGAVSGGATAASTPGGACSGLTSTDQGVTATQIHIDIALFELEGAASNSFIGVPDTTTQQADFQAVVDSINKAGGVQCRKLVVDHYYVGNFLDTTEQHSVCLSIVQDKVFAALDAVALDSTQQGRDCVAEAKIPLFDSGAILGSETRGPLAGYEFSAADQFDYAVRDSILGAKQLGWFNGMKKLGVLQDDCFPEVNSQTLSLLGQIGIPSSQIVTYDFAGCQTVPPPQEVEQAVLSFQSAGVTHVTDLSQVPKSGFFSKAAQAQNYHPKYDVTGGAPSVFDGSSGSSAGPDANNFNGGLSITELSYGQQNTPTIPYSPATADCNKIMAAAGQQSVQQQGAFFAGGVCDLVWMLQMAAQHATPLTRANLATGLLASGPNQWVESFPNGVGLFDHAGVVSAGEFWRADVYDGSCPCFRIPDPTWHPNL